MIDKLKYMIDHFENNARIKELLLKVAELKEENQEDALKFIELFIKGMKK